MEKEFVPYELALRLKAIGFDFSVMAWSDVYTDHIIIMSPDNWCNMNIRKDCVSRPTFSQAFRFFRNKYSLHHVINKGFGFFGTNVILEENRHDSRQNKIVPYHIPKYFDKHNTYEEAELACLEKLLEIVESKSE